MADDAAVVRADFTDGTRGARGKGKGKTIPAEGDDWSLGAGPDDDYDASRFYVAATRSSENMGQVRIAPRDALLVQQILGQQLVPDYKTFQDVMRDAIHHRLVWLEANGVLTGEMRRELKLSAAEKALARMLEEQRAFDSCVEMVREMLERNRRDEGTLTNLQARCLELADTVNDQRRAEALGLVREITTTLATLGPTPTD